MQQTDIRKRYNLTEDRARTDEEKNKRKTNPGTLFILTAMQRLSWQHGLNHKKF